MLNNGAKWYNFSPPRWSFIAPPLTPIWCNALPVAKSMPVFT